MGNKKKKQKHKEADPIVKRIKKKPPKPSQEQEDQQDQRPGTDQEDEDKRISTVLVDWKNNQQQSSNYQSFLRFFKVQQPNENGNDVFNLNQLITAKQQFKTSKTTGSRKITSLTIIGGNQILKQDHFEKDMEAIKRELCGVMEQEKNQSTELENFFQESKQKLSQTLNNGVVFKNYQIEAKHKGRTLLDLKIPEEDYFFDQMTARLLVSGPHLTLANQIVPTRASFTQELIRNFFDYIFQDPDEENVHLFRQLYASHIRKFLWSPRTTFGFTRCKVLILAPFRGDAISIIEYLLGDTETVYNKERYEKEFCNEERLMDDDFRIGISFSIKGAIKLHANFDKSDIIVASPLGLRLITGVEGEQKREYHFLSSLEILVLDRASAILMQNWEHLETILDLSNRLPEHKYITQELTQIRPYFFENMSKFYRQTIVYTNHYFQELNFVRRTYMQNYKGCVSNKIYYQPKLMQNDHFQQEFRHFDCESIEHSLEARAQQFKRLWNDIERKQWKKTLIFVQQYYDFVKLKNYFRSINSGIVCVSEYTKKSKAQSIISQFKAAKVKYIMTTERSYFFEILQLRQMFNAVFYQLPQHSTIYKTIVDGIEELGEKTQLITFYSKYDAYILEPIVGSVKAEEMLSNESKGTTFIL